jgi:hypothetical protein
MSSPTSPLLASLQIALECSPSLHLLFFSPDHAIFYRQKDEEATLGADDGTKDDDAENEAKDEDAKDEDAKDEDAKGGDAKDEEPRGGDEDINKVGGCLKSL